MPGVSAPFSARPRLGHLSGARTEVTALWGLQCECLGLPGHGAIFDIVKTKANQTKKQVYT